MSDDQSGLARVMKPLDDAMDDLRACYVDLHRHPELSFQETRTAGIVADRLTTSGYEVASGVGGTGVVGVLRNGDGPTVALRADMDALPVQEQTGLPYASDVTAKDPEGNEVPVMHACGHDAHTTCMVGAADLLARARDEWAGTLLWFAQPAEERIAGARDMLTDGLYDRFGTPGVVLGQHVGALPAGMVFHRPGPMMAATLSLDVTITGRGGHGSRPESTVDPIVVGAFMVSRLQTIVSREIEPVQPAVVTVGQFHAGTKSNIIPDRAKFSINIRSYDDKVQRRVIDAIERIVRAEADAAGCPEPPQIVRYDGGPVTSNDAAVVDEVKQAHLDWFGPERVMDLPEPIMGSEDFGLFAHPDGDPTTPRTVPTAFWFWGGAGADQLANAPGDDMMEKIKSLPSNHHPGFMVDPEPTLRSGVEALTVAALAYLRN
jgi:hippurate hydrolase